MLEELNALYEEEKRKKEELEREVESCQTRLWRSEKIITGLGSEKESWIQKQRECELDRETLLADSIFCACALSYFGVFPTNYRQVAVEKFQQIIAQTRIKQPKRYSLLEKLSNPILVGKWISEMRLPNDQFSIDNAIILKSSTRTPICIDPQNQANAWIKSMEAAQNLIIVNPFQPQSDILMFLENAIEIGYPVLLENVQEQIHPHLLEPIVFKDYTKVSTQYLVQLGDKTLTVARDFVLYMTCKLSNPVFSPEVGSKMDFFCFFFLPHLLNSSYLRYPFTSAIMLTALIL